MSANPMRVTALIDTYNYGHFIEEAVESVLSQDFPAEQMEVIVVDDGSTDDTRQRVARFGERVRYIYKENGGQASALNTGFAAARGEIIALLDGDDLWLPGKLQRVVQEFEKHPEAGMVYHPFKYWDMQRDARWQDDSFPAVSGRVPARLMDMLTYGSVSTSGMAFRRSALQKLLPVPEGMKIYADSYLGYLAIFVAPVVAIREHLTRYRLHGQNLASHAGADAQRARQRRDSFHVAVQEMRSWLRSANFDLHKPEIAAYLKRKDLVEQMLGFAVVPPVRGKFFAHLWATQKLYQPVWTPGYRMFRMSMAVTAFFLGYHAFQHLQASYRSGTMLRAREWLLPAKRSGSAGAPAASGEGTVALP